MELEIKLTLDEDGEFDYDLTAEDKDGDYCTGIFDSDDEFNQILDALNQRFIQLSNANLK